MRISLLLASLTLLLAPLSLIAAETPPNIILIMADKKNGK